MFSYQITYRMHVGAFFAEVPEFPEASAFGPTLSGARDNLLAALRYAAQRLLRAGEPMPLPAGRPAGDAYLVERVVLLPVDDDQMEVRITAN